LKVTEFFERTKLALRMKGNEQDRDKGVPHVRRLERAFMVTTDIFRKYLSIFEKLVPVFSADVFKVLSDESSDRKFFRALWLFFINYKGIIFHSGNERSPLLDRAPAFLFLVACIICATENLDGLKPNADVGPPLKRLKTGKDQIRSRIRMLCKDTRYIESDVLQYIDSLRETVPRDTLALLPISSSSDSRPLDALLEKLTKKYEEQIHNPDGDGTIDERLFTDAPEFLGVTQTVEKFDLPAKPFVPTGTGEYYMKLTKSSGDALDALAAVAHVSPRSPCEKTMQKVPKPIPQTPVSVSIVSVTWLKSLADTRPENAGFSPPKQSQHFERMLSRDSWVAICSRAQKMLCTYWRKHYGTITANQKIRETTAVYFSSLEGVMLAEEKRLKTSNLDALVNNGTFHRALLAISCETASVAYGRRDFAPFPKILNDLDIEPFDMTKVVESFIKHTPSLPKAVGRHLLRCEERILEKLAWMPGSALVGSLEIREEKYRGENGSADDSQQSDTFNFSQGTVDLISSSQLSESVHENGRTAAIPSVGNGSHDATESAGVVPKPFVEVPEAALDIFFRKLLFLGSGRLQALSTRAGLSSIQVENAWSALKYILSEKWKLLVGRHLDQMIMCCVYGVAKLSQETSSMKFSDITRWYEVLPHTREESFKQYVSSIYVDVKLSVDGEKERGDIIQFYNQVFVQNMKRFLLQCRSRDLSKKSIASEDVRDMSRDPIQAQILASPMRRTSNTEQQPRVVGKVKISSMSPSSRMQMSRAGFGAPLGTMSPATRTLYAFGESPVLNYHNLNRNLEEGRRLRLNSREENSEESAVNAIWRKYADVFSMAPVAGFAVENDKAKPVPTKLGAGKPPLPVDTNSPTKRDGK